MSTLTDHGKDITRLRERAAWCRERFGSLTQRAVTYELAADLLEIHDQTGLSLDNWASARAFVEHRIGHEITENGV